MWGARRTLIALGILVPLGFASYFVLLVDGEPPALSTYALDLQRARNMALGGELPLRINAEVVAKSRVPSIALMAGNSPFTHDEMVRTAFQIVYPDERSVIVDAGLDAAMHEEHGPPGPFYAERYAAVQRALPFADHILITHAHPDHIGGITRSPNLEHIEERIVLTRAQLDNRELLERVHFPFEALADLKPLEYAHYHRLAPGIVLIAAPGHTPGSQMVFVRLKSGAEFLLLGDVAWHMDNVREPRGRALAISAFVVGEDRGAVLHQLRALHELQRTGIHMVPSHDGAHLAKLREHKLIGAAFE